MRRLRRDANAPPGTVARRGGVGRERGLLCRTGGGQGGTVGNVAMESRSLLPIRKVAFYQFGAGVGFKMVSARQMSIKS